MRSDFCVFILTHGRPDRVHTYETLMRANYTGKVFFVIDDEDPAEQGYRKRFGDKVLQFCKRDWAQRVDAGDNFESRKALVYARHACWDLARSVGCRYFMQFDDDYTSFFIRFDRRCRYISHKVRNADRLLTAMLYFYESVPALSLAMSQGGDHLGGSSAGKKRPILHRKCMNSWLCDVEKPIDFFGRMNDDVSTYVTLGRRGELFFTALAPMLVQKPTQVTEGRMSEVYKESGTYTKSFYSVMAAPSCVQIGTMGDPRTSVVRIHHKINWNNAVPKILSQEWKKQEG